MARTRSHTPAAYNARARTNFRLAREVLASARRLRDLGMTDLVAGRVAIARSLNQSGVHCRRSAAYARRQAAWAAKHPAGGLY